MSVVTIEGTVMPAAGALRRGERKTVQYTDRIERLVERGFVKIIEEHDTPVPVDELVLTTRTLHTVIDGEEAEIHFVTDGIPSRSGSTETWRSFLKRKGISYPDDATRDQMISYWDKVTGR